MFGPTHKYIPGPPDGEGGGGAGDQSSPLDRGQGPQEFAAGDDVSLPSPAKRSPDEVRLRWYIYRDVAEILRIERATWETPRTEQELVRLFRQRNMNAIVAERNKVVEGFAMYKLLKRSCHIVNLAVDPSVRRTGVGTLIFEDLIDRLSSYNYTAIQLTVSEYNVGAQLFLQKCGFKAVSVLPGRFGDSCGDRYVMRYRLPD